MVNNDKQPQCHYYLMMIKKMMIRTLKKVIVAGLTLTL